MPFLEPLDKSLDVLGYVVFGEIEGHWVTLLLAATTGDHPRLSLGHAGPSPLPVRGVVSYGAVGAGHLNVYPEGHLRPRRPVHRGANRRVGRAGGPDFFVGVIDKVVQVALIGLLGYLYRNEERLVG